MRADRWIVTTLFLLSLGVITVIMTSYRMDVFGLFHDPTGRQLTVNDNVRTSKFLLNERYVPANFDAILIGSSATMNWDLTKLDFAKVYNESIAGANIGEEKRLVDQALPKAHFKYAICLVSPFLVQSHTFNEGNGKPTRREALGSINVLREELVYILRKLQNKPSPHYSDGSEELVAPVRLDPPFSPERFDADSIAVETYRELLTELRQRGVKIIFIRAPYYGPVYDRDRKMFESFYAGLPLQLPGEPVIRFDTAKYAGFRANPANWNSVGHLSDRGAIQAGAALNAEAHSEVPGLPGAQIASALPGLEDHNSPGRPRSSSSIGVRPRSSTQAILRPLKAEPNTGAQSAMRPFSCN